MSQTLQLGEVIVDRIIEKLQLNLTTRLAAINTEKNDGIRVIAPKKTSYFRGRSDQVPAPPAIFVMEGNGTFREEGPHSIISRYEILIFVLESAQTGQELAVRLQRQTRAIIESLWDDPPQEALEGSAFRLFPLRTVPGTVTAAPGRGRDRWRSFSTVVFVAEQFES